MSLPTLMHVERSRLRNDHPFTACYLVRGSPHSRRLPCSPKCPLDGS